MLIKPQKSKGTGSGGGGGAEEALICPSSFSVDIEEKVPLEAPLRLQEEDGGLAVYFGGKKVAEVEKEQTRKIILCMTAGYRYNGTVKEKKNGTRYGKFIQTL